MQTCFLLRYTVSSILLDIISFSLAFLFYDYFLPSVEIKPRKRYQQMAQQRMANSQVSGPVFGKMSSRLQRLMVPHHHSSPNLQCLQQER